MDEAIASAAFDYYSKNLYTAFPAIVLSSDFSKASVDVRIAVDLIDQTGATTPRPTISSIPLVYPSSGSSAITFPVVPGDTVLLVFSARSMDSFKSNGSTTPNNFRKHNINDAIAIPGLFPFNKPRTAHGQEPDALVLTHNIGGSQCEIHMKSDGSILAKTPTKFSIQCSEFELNSSGSAKMNASAITMQSSGDTTMQAANIGMSASSGGSATMTGNFNLNGDLKATGNNSFNGISVDKHKHMVIATGQDTDFPGT